MRRLFALLEGEGEVKLAKGVKSLAQVLKRGGFEVWFAPKPTYNHWGKEITNTSMPSQGKFNIARYAGWDYVVRCSLGSPTGIEQVDADRRKRIIKLVQQAREFLSKQGFQVSDYKLYGSDTSFVVQGKMPP